MKKNENPPDTDYERHMKTALEEAEKALSAGEFPVGCVMVYRNRVVARGSRTGTAGTAASEIDHAEMAALRALAAGPLKPDFTKVTVFSTMEPCLMCFGALLIHGISTIVYAYEDVMGGGTACDLARLPALYRGAGVRVVPHVLRSESLALFKAYFSNPKHSYWRGSLLARYTLAQVPGKK